MNAATAGNGAEGGLASVAAGHGTQRAGSHPTDTPDSTDPFAVRCHVLSAMLAHVQPAAKPNLVLVCSGGLIPMPGTDMTHPFAVHPDFAYLTGIGLPDSVLAFDPSAARDPGAWQLFCARTTADAAVWCQPAPHHGRPLDELARWLAERPKRAVTVCGDTNWLTACPDAELAATLAARAAADSGHRTEVIEAIAEMRRVKDRSEIASLQQAAEATHAGFEWVFNTVKPGMTEREVLVGIEAAFFNAGAPRVAYGTIVAAGSNSSFLHYVPEATDSLRPPSNRIEAGDLLLIDAGAQIDGYACDVTRTMVVGAEPTEAQRFIWQLVATTQANAIGRCYEGTEWRDVHLAAAIDLATGLVEMGVLVGEPAELVSSGAASLFFPHGLGHLIGLAVHDAGGYRQGSERHFHPLLRYLRTDRPLQEGMVTSVEPGIYFIEALLGDDELRQRFERDVNWPMVDDLRGFGGIRIEDDVLVTASDPVVLTEAIEQPELVGELVG